MPIPKRKKNETDEKYRMRVENLQRKEGKSPKQAKAISFAVINSKKKKKRKKKK